MTARPFRIGTRDSILATWQARFVQERLQDTGHPAELRFIKTEGDRVLDTPLPLMGGKGVFTKALDDALLAGEIDMAVHSFKDIPTRIPAGLTIGAVSGREDTADVLVTRDAARRFINRGGEGAPEPGTPSMATPGFLDDPGYEALIASSSNRRIGQWLARFPLHRMTDIRGNVQTRLRKLAESDWDGAIFAAAGLIRLGLQAYMSLRLEWMLPAPAQGAMAIMIREDDGRTRDALRGVHDQDAALCTKIERDILHALEGGCSAPVGALAVVDHGQVRLRANVVYPDGTGLISCIMQEVRDRADDLGIRAADEIRRRGGDALIQNLSRAGTQDQPAARWPDGSRPRIVLSTRLATPGDVTLAKQYNLRLADYPVWLYHRINLPSDVVASLLEDPSADSRAGSPMGGQDEVRTDTRPSSLAGARPGGLAGARVDAWVFTSRRGVDGWWHACKDEYRPSSGIPPIYTVGEATADTVRRRFPEADVRMPRGGDGTAIGEALARDCIRSAVHFCAVDRHPELKAVCRKHNIGLMEVEVYGRVPVPDPKPIHTECDAIFFYSPDGVAEFCRVYGVPDGEWHPVAIGRTTADAVRRETGREPLIPEYPGFEEMIKLVSYRLATRP